MNFTSVSNIALSIKRNEVGDWFLLRSKVEFPNGRKQVSTPKVFKFRTRKGVAQAFLLNLFKVGRINQIASYKKGEFNQIIESLNWAIMKLHDVDRLLSNNLSDLKVNAVNFYEQRNSKLTNKNK